MIFLPHDGYIVPKSPGKSIRDWAGVSPFRDQAVRMPTDRISPLMPGPVECGSRIKITPAHKKTPAPADAPGRIESRQTGTPSGDRPDRPFRI